MDILHPRARTAGLLAALLVAWTFSWTGPDEPSGSSTSLARSQYWRGALACQIDDTPGRARHLRFTLTEGPTLARGTRIAWSTLGNPLPSGDLRSLPRELAAGQSVSFELPSTTADAAGCVARAWMRSDG